ncbi:FAD-binding domain-containing protein [Leptolyngbya sp. FACHB-711]|uniref:FAD-binding domain-containing protein n=1 Tax=unclassified Leptolyngbya TaxID=2650499 RepID=UPI0016858514|nr:FAD-binding domain-containing protein [Leptolyngbya sp. FACHB-711]MBD1851940.1 deoxyribodipyrimidine photo-lyase [Cyanobacteria bacterium FACHB-502]MBD2027777.1 deoxyribodipyrimidine photo-lyase [Leptolyngbya sp. FACHB-711]
MTDLILFWHRRDLRTVDNIGLAAARQKTPRVVGVFCLDRLILDRDDVAPARVTYLIESLRELQQQYTQAGSQLLILEGNPIERIPALAKALNVKAVHLNRDVEPYGRERDRTVAAALREAGIEVQPFWDQLLHAPRAVITGSGQPYTVFSPFWRNWRSQPKAAPALNLEGATGLTEAEQQAAQAVGTIASGNSEATALPSAKDLGFVWDVDVLPLAPGTSAAMARLEEFCNDSLTEYGEQRNFPSVRGTSQLSAALKFGTIGVRTIWAATEQVYDQSRSDETRENVQSWQQEIAWREFYQHAMYSFPELADGAYRDSFKNFPWENRDDYFQAWCEGRTGYPIVDAAIRQMNTIGWMHNRCRMIVASFMVKDLLLDPRLGEKYFMQKLVDGDLSANNGGWQWTASSGMDPKPLRIFNPASQAQKFDPEADYIREYLPELRSIDTADLVTGKIGSYDRERCGYPEPIVDHKVQQNRFKQIYQQQKEVTALS